MKIFIQQFIKFFFTRRHLDYSGINIEKTWNPRGIKNPKVL